MTTLAANPMLLADWGQLIGLLVFLVLAGLRMMAEMGGEAKKAQGKRQPPPRPKTRPNGPQPAAGNADLRSEVDEFLRRAQGKPKPRPAPELELVEEDRPWTNTVELEAVRPQTEPDPGESVSDHVALHVRHLQESQLAEKAAKLGSEVALADDKVRARLDAKFKHSLGKIAKQEEPRAEEPPVPPESAFNADQIAAMLSTPEGMRNAVVLNEILQRPMDRW